MKRIAILAASAMTILTSNAMAQGFGSAPQITFFDGTNYSGNTASSTGEMTQFTSMNDRASSIQVRGTWQICEHSRFRGRCTTISGDVPDLRVLRFNNNISSARPISGDSSGPSDPGYSTYRMPKHEGRFIAYCGNKGDSTCGKPSADAFCRSKGHSSAVSFSKSNIALSPIINMVEMSVRVRGEAFSQITCNGSGSGGGNGGSGPGFGGGNGGGNGGSGPGFGGGNGGGNGGSDPGFGGGNGGGNGGSGPGFGGGNGSAPAYATYRTPQDQGRYIAYCGVKSPSTCGKPSADAYCRAKGHKSAISFVKDKGVRSPIFNPLENSVRTSGETFGQITCERN